MPTLADKIAVEDNLGNTVMVDTTAWSPAFIAYMVAYGWKVRLARSTASAKDPAQAKLTMYQDMVKGEYTTAGRGPSLDKESSALHTWLEKNGHKGKKGDLEPRLISLAYATLVNQGMDKDQASKVAPTKIDQLKSKIKETPQYKAIIAVEQTAALALDL